MCATSEPHALLAIKRAILLIILQGEKLKYVIQRLRGAISITLDNSKYENDLAALRDRNCDLYALRSQISAFQQTTHGITSLIRQKTLPGRFNSIQNASQKLHEALCNAWCCDDTAHRGHFAKLCLNAVVESEGQFDMAISCYDNNTDGANM